MLISGIVDFGFNNEYLNKVNLNANDIYIYISQSFFKLKKIKLWLIEKNVVTIQNVP